LGVEKELEILFGELAKGSGQGGVKKKDEKMGKVPGKRHVTTLGKKLKVGGMLGRNCDKKINYWGI